LRIHAQVPETDLPLFGFMSAADMVRYFQDATPPDIAQYQREEEQRFGNSLMQEFLAFKSFKQRRAAAAVAAAVAKERKNEERP
jgi:hypothetical protein